MKQQMDLHKTQKLTGVLIKHKYCDLKTAVLFYLNVLRHKIFKLRLFDLNNCLSMLNAQTSAINR